MRFLKINIQFSVQVLTLKIVVQKKFEPLTKESSKDSRGSKKLNEAQKSLLQLSWLSEAEFFSV